MLSHLELMRHKLKENKIVRCSYARACCVYVYIEELRGAFHREIEGSVVRGLVNALIVPQSFLTLCLK